MVKIEAPIVIIGSGLAGSIGEALGAETGSKAATTIGNAVLQAAKGLRFLLEDKEFDFYAYTQEEIMKENFGSYRFDW